MRYIFMVAHAAFRNISYAMKQLVVAISSRALFQLEASHDVFIKQGRAAYCDYQISHEDEKLQAGVAFSLVRKLLALNEYAPTGERFVEVILLSRNSADTGLRIFNSIQAHALDITRAAFTAGTTPYRYASAFGTHLFLSADVDDVCSALDAGMAAAVLLPSVHDNSDELILRIAFDGDAVLFSDEAEQVFHNQGLEAFASSEQKSAHTPLAGGPFKDFLAALQYIQAALPIKNTPLRTCLVTARSAPAHERVIRTLRTWNIRIDEALFLGGLSKGEFLAQFGADIFFDDRYQTCANTSRHVASGHVPSCYTR
ncbi:MAG: 5'-nucleotidase [Mariprofundales bacterium]